jgi:hypothetical protein
VLWGGILFLYMFCLLFFLRGALGPEGESLTWGGEDDCFVGEGVLLWEVEAEETEGEKEEAEDEEGGEEHLVGEGDLWCGGEDDVWEIAGDP